MADPAAAAPPVMSPEDIAYAARIVFIEQVYFCAMYAVVVWDWVSSLSKEYRLIWKKQWTPVKVLYLLCRYWPICVVPWCLYVYTINHPHEFCTKSFRSVPALMTVNMILAELILLIRTHAFLGRKTWLLILMLSSLLTVFIYQLWALIANMDLLALGPPTVPSPCFPVAKPGTRHVMGFFVAPLIFDAAITGLSVYKALSMRWNLPWSKARESTSIVNTFINEGLFYFLLITTANLLNGIFYLQSKQVIQAMNIPLSIMLPNILACRLILALRERGTHSDLHLSTRPSTGGGSGLNASVGRSDPHQVTFGGTGAKRGFRSDIETVNMTTLGQHDHELDQDSDKGVGLDDKVRVPDDEEHAIGGMPTNQSYHANPPFADLTTTVQGGDGGKRRPNTGQSTSPMVRVEIERSYV